jgi:threonine aldolase
MRTICKDFRSDNTHGCSPEVLDAIRNVAAGTMTSYGDDPVTRRLRDRCCELFETDVDVFPVISGTAGNALAIAATAPNRVYCHEDAHILLEEEGATELFSGAKLVPCPGVPGKINGKVDPGKLALQPGGCLSITNATEAGTVYTVEELRLLGELARTQGTAVHLDGARFANAVASIGCTPAELTWRVGVDVLTFGATKNGAFGAEVIVLFRRELSETLARLCHRSGQRLSKMRLLSAQLEAMLTDDLWLRNARHSNAMARRLRDGLAGSVDIVRPVDANIVFARLPPPLVASLEAQGYTFFDWRLFGEDVYRLVCGFCTTEEDVDTLANLIHASLRTST